MHVTFRLTPLLLLAGALAGCATAPPRTTTPPPDPALIALNSSAARISKSLTQLTRLQQVGTPAVPVYQTPTSGALSTPVTLNWAGSAAPAVKAIAQMVGGHWHVKEVGRPPLVPVVVHINVTGVPAYKVLEDIGWQAGQKTGVVVDRASRTIEVVYVGTDN